MKDAEGGDVGGCRSCAYIQPPQEVVEAGTEDRPMVSLLRDAQRISVRTMTSKENMCHRSRWDERASKRLGGLWTRAYSNAGQAGSSIGFEWPNLSAVRKECSAAVASSDPQDVSDGRP